MLSWFNSFQLLNSVDYYFLSRFNWNPEISMQVIVTYVIEIPRWYFFLFKLLIFQLPIINLLHKIRINEEKKKRNK